MRCALDHLVVAAETLDAGEAYVRETLGVELQPGGKHALMSTHNRLLRLGDSAYLEVIAIDPDAPPPARPRWFALDDPAMRARIAERPRLIHWVAQTDDIDAALRACPVPLGTPTALSRGDLRWKFALSDDGSMPFDGMAPDVIQWLDGAHPSQRLEPSGVELLALEARHPNADGLAATLAALALSNVCAVAPAPSAQLRAQLKTPSGPVWIS
jgi:hypothetical protein